MLLVLTSLRWPRRRRENDTSSRYSGPDASLPLLPYLPWQRGFCRYVPTDFLHECLFRLGRLKFDLTIIYVPRGKILLINFCLCEQPSYHYPQQRFVMPRLYLTYYSTYSLIRLIVSYTLMPWYSYRINILYDSLQCI